MPNTKRPFAIKTHKGTFEAGEGLNASISDSGNVHSPPAAEGGEPVHQLHYDQRRHLYQQHGQQPHHSLQEQQLALQPFQAGQRRVDVDVGAIPSSGASPLEPDVKAAHVKMPEALRTGKGNDHRKSYDATASNPLPFPPLQMPSLWGRRQPEPPLSVTPFVPMRRASYAGTAGTAAATLSPGSVRGPAPPAGTAFVLPPIVASTPPQLVLQSNTVSPVSDQRQLPVASTYSPTDVFVSNARPALYHRQVPSEPTATLSYGAPSPFVDLQHWPLDEQLLAKLEGLCSV